MRCAGSPLIPAKAGIHTTHVNSKPAPDPDRKAAYRDQRAFVRGRRGERLSMIAIRMSKNNLSGKCPYPAEIIAVCILILHLSFCLTIVSPRLEKAYMRVKSNPLRSAGTIGAPHPNRLHTDNTDKTATTRIRAQFKPMTGAGTIRKIRNFHRHFASPHPEWLRDLAGV